MKIVAISGVIRKIVNHALQMQELVVGYFAAAQPSCCCDLDLDIKENLEAMKSQGILATLSAVVISMSALTDPY